MIPEPITGQHYRYGGYTVTITQIDRQRDRVSFIGENTGRVKLSRFRQYATKSDKPPEETYRSTRARQQRKEEARRIREAVRERPGEIKRHPLADKPGEAEAKMIAAGTHKMVGGALVEKEIVGFYEDPTTGTKRFVARGEAPPTYQVPAPAPTPIDYATAFHEELERVRTMQAQGWAGRPGAPDEPGEAVWKAERAGVFDVAREPTRPRWSLYEERLTKYGMGGERQWREYEVLVGEYKQLQASSASEILLEKKGRELDKKYVEYVKAHGAPPTEKAAELKSTAESMRDQEPYPTTVKGLFELQARQWRGVGKAADVTIGRLYTDVIDPAIEKALGTDPEGMKRFAAGAAAGVPMLLPALYTPWLAGVGTRIIGDPLGTPTRFERAGLGLVESFRKDPLMTSGFFAGVLGGRGVSRRVTKTVKPTVTRLGYQTAEGVSVGLPKGVGFGFEITKGGVTKFEGLSVTPLAEQMFTLRTPKVMEFHLKTEPSPAPLTTAELKAPPVELYTPKTALESQIIGESLGIEGAKFIEAQKFRWETTKAGVRIKDVRPAMREVLESHGISGKKVTGEIIDSLRKQNGEMYGSLIQRAASREALARVPRDFDVAVRDPTGFAKDVAARINKAEGKTVVIAKGGKVTVKKTGAKLFDVHSLDMPAPTGAYLPTRERIGWGMVREPRVPHEGIKLQTFSEQMSRKLEGAMAVARERTVEAPMLGVVRGKIIPKYAGRIKDILDEYTGELFSIKRLRERGQNKAAARAEKHLEKWLDAWGPDVAKKVREIAKQHLKAGVVPELRVKFYPDIPSPPPLVIPPLIPPSLLSSIPPYSPPAIKYPSRAPPSIRYPPSPYEPPYPSRAPPSIRYPPSPYEPPYPSRAPPSIKYPPPHPPIVPEDDALYPPPKPRRIRIPKDDKKKKKAQRKLRRVRAEKWEIRNPVATLEEIMWGRQMEGTAKKKPKKGGKKK